MGACACRPQGANRRSSNRSPAGRRARARAASKARSARTVHRGAAGTLPALPADRRPGSPRTLAGLGEHVGVPPSKHEPVPGTPLGGGRTSPYGRKRHPPPPPPGWSWQPARAHTCPRRQRDARSAIRPRRAVWRAGANRCANRRATALLCTALRGRVPACAHRLHSVKCFPRPPFRPFRGGAIASPYHPRNAKRAPRVQWRGGCASAPAPRALPPLVTVEHDRLAPFLPSPSHHLIQLFSFPPTNPPSTHLPSYDCYNRLLGVWAWAWRGGMGRGG